MTEQITTHILNLECGQPAPGVAVTLSKQEGELWQVCATAKTDGDGRAALAPSALMPAVYRLTFATGDYFAALKQKTLYPSVSIDFELSEPEMHYHIPLLLNRFGYSTYRGS